MESFAPAPSPASSAASLDRGRPAAPPARLTGLGDELLARLVSRGSDRAFAVLYGRYQRSLYRYCYSMVRDAADAEDALQSAFTAALVALREGRRNAPLRPWLYRIVHNEAVSLLRRRRAVDPAEVPLQHAPSAEEHAAGRARLAQLVADLDEVPPRARSALLMRELNGLSHEEIAAALGTSPGAAKQAIFEARNALLELSEGRTMACEEVRRTLSDGDGRTLRGRRLRAHLRDCAGCAAFAAAIPARRADLNAIAPVLPAAASAALLGRALANGAGRSGTASGAGTVAAGGAGKTVGAVVLGKAVAGVVVLASAVAGVGGVVAALRHPSRAGASITSASPASRGAGVGRPNAVGRGASARTHGAAVVRSGAYGQRRHRDGAAVVGHRAVAHREASGGRGPGSPATLTRSGSHGGGGGSASSTAHRQAFSRAGSGQGSGRSGSGQSQHANRGEGSVRRSANQRAATPAGQTIRKLNLPKTIRPPSSGASRKSQAL